MRFNDNSQIRDKHAILSPSYYHWLNYDDAKLQARMHSLSAANRGTRLHNFAHNAIELSILLPEDPPTTMSLYVNDGIRYKMRSELGLYYSMNCFGHADSLAFRNETLRIHDLKTGLGKTSFKQLEVYAALFCLEYGVRPRDIDMELRIYQNDEVLFHEPTPEVIEQIMERVVELDAKIEEFKKGEDW